MADNITLNTGSGGATAWTDEVAGSKHAQIVKLADGTADSTTVIASGGGVEASALRVTIASDSTGVVSVDDNGASLTVDNGGTFAVQVDGSALTALQLLDDVVHVDDTATHSTGSTKGALIMAAATPTDGSVDANDIGAVAMSLDRRLLVDAQIVGQDASLTVDLGATDNAVLDAIAASVAGTLSVSASSLPLPSGAATAAKQPALGTAGTASTDVLSVQGIASMTPLLVDATGQGDVPITLAGESVAVTNAGTFATQVDGAALTALQLLDDPVFADDAAFTLGSSKVAMAGAVRDDALSTLTAVEGDAVPLRVNSTGALHVTGGGGGTEYAVDDALGSTPTGSVALATRDDALSTLTPVEGDAVALRTNASGALWVIPSGTVAVDGSGVTQPVSAASLPLPTGAATAAKQPALGTAGSASSDVITVQGVASMTALVVDGSAVTQPVSAASLPLPTGAATAANQSTIIGHVDGIEGLLTTIDADTGSIATSAATIAGAVSGSEMQVDVVASALPTGAATAANQSTGNSSLSTIATNTTAAASKYRNVDANAEDAIKGSAGTLYWLHAVNLTASVAYLHLYDATTASVTPGTTTPTFTFPIPTQGDTNGAGFTINLGANGQAFGTAITLVVTTTIDGSAGDPGTNGVMVNAGYT